MKIIKFHKRITKIMQTYKFHLKIMKIMKKSIITLENYENHEILEFHSKITNIMKN